MANKKIDIKKPIRLSPDVGLHKADMLFVKKIIFSNGNVCLCTVEDEDGEELEDDNRTLFDLKTGEVLTMNIEYGNYYAENYKK